MSNYWPPFLFWVGWHPKEDTNLYFFLFSLKNLSFWQYLPCPTVSAESLCKLSIARVSKDCSRFLKEKKMLVCWFSKYWVHFVSCFTCTFFISSAIHVVVNLIGFYFYFYYSFLLLTVLLCYAYVYFSLFSPLLSTWIVQPENILKPCMIKMILMKLQ